MENLTTISELETKAAIALCEDLGNKFRKCSPNQEDDRQPFHVELIDLALKHPAEEVRDAACNVLYDLHWGLLKLKQNFVTSTEIILIGDRLLGAVKKAIEANDFQGQAIVYHVISKLLPCAKIEVVSELIDILLQVIEQQIDPTNTDAWQPWIAACNALATRHHYVYSSREPKVFAVLMSPHAQKPANDVWLYDITRLQALAAFFRWAEPAIRDQIMADISLAANATVEEDEANHEWLVHHAACEALKQITTSC